MKIGAEREDLQTLLSKSLYEISLDKNKKERLIQFMGNRGYLAGDVKMYLAGNVMLDTLFLIDLGVLTLAVYKITNKEKLNPENWFEEGKVNQIEKYTQPANKKILEYPLVFKPVLQLDHNRWRYVGTMEEVINLYESDMITYNFNTQRDAKLYRVKGEFQKRPNVNYESVKQITDELVEGKYIPDEISFNLLKDGTDAIIYNEDDMSLTILDGELNIIDGYHNSIAIMSAKEKGISGVKYPIQFFNYDEAKAGQFIDQKNKQNKIESNHLAAMNMSELENTVARELNESAVSDFRGKIATDRAYINNGLALTMYLIMTETIKKLWNLKSRRDSRMLAEYLIDFFNELFGIYPEEFNSNIKNSKRYTNINHESIFIFYLVLAKELQGRENWRELLEKTITALDFSKDNEDWGDVGFMTTSIDRLTRHMNSMIEYSEAKIKEVL